MYMAWAGTHSKVVMENLAANRLDFSPLCLGQASTYTLLLSGVQASPAFLSVSVVLQ